MSGVDPSGDDNRDLPATLVRALERACDRFEAACRAGQRPRLEDYLNEMPEAGRPALLSEMRALEQVTRDRGPAPPADWPTEPTGEGTAAAESARPAIVDLNRWAQRGGDPILSQVSRVARVGPTTPKRAR
jgi:hypothetical protein